jgi:hypothetical protein
MTFLADVFRGIDSTKDLGMYVETVHNFILPCLLQFVVHTLLVYNTNK